MNSESAVSPETALITLPSRPQKRFSAQYSRDKQGDLSTYQCATSLGIGNHVGHRHARQVARAHERRGHVAGAPELDAQDGRLGGQKRNSRARKPNPWRPARTRRNRERFAKRRGRARTIRERRRRDANGRGGARTIRERRRRDANGRGGARTIRERGVRPKTIP